MGSKADVVTALGGAGIELGGHTFTAASTDIVTEASHGWVTGDGPFQVSTTDDDLPAGLAVDTDYYVIKLTDDTFKLATSYANAIAGTPVVDITDAGTGTHTISATVAAFVNKIESALRERLQYGNKCNLQAPAESQFWDELLEIL